MKLHNTRDEDIILEAVLACYRERFDEGAEVVTLRSLFLLDPIGDEDVGVALFRRVAVGAEDDLLAVRREHREAVEGVVERDAFQPRTVDLDYIKVEVAPFRVIDVRREDNPLAVGEEVRSEAGFVEFCHTAL